MALTTIKTTSIPDDAITSAKIADDAITSALIADNAITSALIANDAVTSAKIADDAVVTAAIADDAVTGANIADDTVAEANMANDAISLTELKAGTDGQIISWDASGNPVAVGPGTDGQVLTSTGAGSPPAFEDAVSEGTQVKSTGESGGTKFLREDGDGTSSWQTLPASGATLSGSTNNTVVTVTGSNAMAGEANLTFDGNNLKVGAGAGTHVDADDLVISKDAAISGISIQNADDGYGCINFGDASDNDIGRIAYQHNGNHMKFQVNADTRMEIEDDGNVKINDGNLIIGTAGHGVDFSATAGPAAGSGTQELLDDYEEGTWTPDVRFNDVSASGQSSNGHYVKIGRMVYASYRFTLTNKGSGDGQFHLNGFPFAPSTGYSDIGGHFGYFHRFADTDNTNGQVYQQFYSSIMYYAFRGLNANTTRLTDDNFRDDCACSGMVVYYTNA